MIRYGFVKTIERPFDEALEHVTDELKKEGLGVLTTIQVHEKFKEKLGIDFKKYVILGACHPPSAHKAIEGEENIGLFLPCNVLVYEKDNRVAVAIVKPTVAMEPVGNTNLADVATDVEARLKRVFDSIT